VTSGTLDQAVAAVRAALEPLVGLDWNVPAGSLSWSCRDTAAHIAHDLLAYAGQVAGRPTDAYLPFDLTVRPDASPAQVLDVVVACARLVDDAITAAPADARGWHWGPTDPSGFAALGVNELLVHTYDITGGLGVPWELPAQLCAVVLARLFPDAPAGDPAAVLLWCTGRAPLGDRPRQTSWRLRAAR
jgi:uncharacterized protein (TIGR03083 family)